MFEKLADPKEIRLVEGAIPIRHRYTPGVAGEIFFSALKERGELVGSRCVSCGITYVPARLFCERCFDELSGDVTVGPQGTLESFTVGFVGLEGEALEEPVPMGLVRLDGADTVLLHFLVDFDDEQPLGIGERVEVALRPEGERTGSILDIRGFRPVS